VFEDHLALMLDLQLLAFQSDLVSFRSRSARAGARPYLWRVPEAHHPRRITTTFRS
jgi:hypothetical protein